MNTEQENTSVCPHGSDFGGPPRHDHNHHNNHEHSHDFRSISKKRLSIALGINAVFLVVEVIGGLLSNSLALLADAGHMLTDVAALMLALFVAHLAERLPTPKRSFGFLRAEVIGAFINGAALVVVVGVIFWEAWRRLGHTPVIDGSLMLVIAVLGLLTNGISALVLYRDRTKNVNMKGAYLHMLADTLGSAGAITAGIVIVVTGWTPVDQIVSVIIGLLILVGSLGLLKETMNILLEATPQNIDFEAVEQEMNAVEHVKEVHDLHIWTIASGIPALSAHVQLYSDCCDTKHWQLCLRDMQTMLRERFGIVHSTLQIEPEDYVKDSRII